MKRGYSYCCHGSREVGGGGREGAHKKHMSPLLPNMYVKCPLKLIELLFFACEGIPEALLESFLQVTDVYCCLESLFHDGSVLDSCKHGEEEKRASFNISTTVPLAKWVLSLTC